MQIHRQHGAYLELWTCCLLLEPEQQRFALQVEVLAKDLPYRQRLFAVVLFPLDWRSRLLVPGGTYLPMMVHRLRRGPTPSIRPGLPS